MSGETPETDAEQAPTSPPAGTSAPPGSPRDAASGSVAHIHAHHRLDLRLLQQLKHRNVIRVGILYLVISWLILDPVHVLFHMLEVPVWANRLVVVLMAAGFPAVLLFAWVYEITPEGLKPTAEVEPHLSIRKLTAQRLDRAIAVVLALGIAYLLIDKFWLSRREATARPVAVPASVTPAAAVAQVAGSVAVLPFMDMSEKRDQEYFSDGLSEELIDMLTKVPDLRVPARTSSFYFKGKQATIADIAKALSVAHVLEGSVRKSGNHVRITAQLVRADNGYHLWSETYDRKLDDIFKIEDEISSAVVAALKATLLGGEAPRRTTARSAEAYALVLQGQYLYLRAAPADVRAAADYFQQATRLDPTYAAAWAGLSKAVGNLPDGWRAQRERALAAAERALALDPQLAEAHIAMGKIHLYFDLDWTAADTEFRRALTLEPRDASALYWAGIFAMGLGRFDDALGFYQQSLAVDPLNPRIPWLIGWVYLESGRPTEAEAFFRKLFELDPANTDRIWGLGLALVLQGEAKAGLAQLDSNPDQEVREYFLAKAYNILGRKADSDAAIARFELKYGKDFPYGVACLRAQRGELDQAFAWLERAFQQRDRSLAVLIADRLCWKTTEDDPRYKGLLRKMKVPE